MIARSCAASSFAAAMTASRVSAFGVIGRMTICVGAIRGGRIRPSSSRVRHDERADHARAHAPARRPAELLLAVACLELDPARARKILPEKMRRAGLDRLPVLHHGFDAEGLDRAGKSFALRFLAR